jgi:hypothetical protein
VPNPAERQGPKVPAADEWINHCEPWSADTGIGLPTAGAARAPACFSCTAFRHGPTTMLR